MKKMMRGRYLFFCIAIAFMSMRSGEPRLYFIHIPKTGGTTLRLLLEQQLSTQEIYPFRHPQSAIGPVKHDLVSGHFPYWYCKKIDPDFENAFKVTILRDPIERYLSFLRAKKKADRGLPTLEAVLHLRRVPHGRYHIGLVDNALCRHLATDPDLEGDALLESAKKTLHEFDAIIFYDHYSEEVIGLFQRLGIALQKEVIPRLNGTSQESISPELLEEVTHLNELDMQLYQYAKASYAKRENTYTLRTQSYEELLKTKAEINYTFDLPLNGYGWTYRDTSHSNIPVFRWVTDEPASISFSLEEGTEYDLFFTAQTISQEVFPKVKANGVEVSISQLNKAPFSLYHGIIAKNIIQNQPVEMIFSSTKAFEYRDIYPHHYNRNHPPLSFALNHIQILKK